MNNFRKSLVALALFAGVTAALAGQVSGMATGKLVDYSWTHYDTDGTTVLESNVIKDPDEAREDFGCETTLSTRCAVGTAPGQAPITLYYQ